MRGKEPSDYRTISPKNYLSCSEKKKGINHFTVKVKIGVHTCSEATRGSSGKEDKNNNITFEFMYLV